MNVMLYNKNTHLSRYPHSINLKQEKMDHNCKTRRKNPQETSNIFSYLTFIYSFDIFKRAYRKDLEEEDIYRAISNHESQKVGDEMERIWKKTDKKNFTLCRLLMKFCGKRYLLLGLIQLFMQTINILLVPTAMSNLVGFFSPKKKIVSKDNAIYSAAIVIGISLMNCFFNQNYKLLIAQIEIRIRTGLSSLIFRKCLKLSTSAMKVHTTGRVVTLLTRDVTEIGLALQFLNYLWISPIEIAIGTYILYMQSGITTFISIGLIIFLLILQVIVARVITVIRLKAAKKMDERLQITQEILTAIRLIKMFTWEDVFWKKVSTIRKQEVWRQFQLHSLKGINRCFSVFSVELSILLHFLAYFWFHDDISAGQFYLILTCFRTMTTSLVTFLPGGIINISEVYAAANRIGNFLNATEWSPLRVEKDSSGNPEISLVNASVSINKTFVLKNVNLELYKGLNLVTGPVGSGKSCLLKIILQEYSLTSGKLYRQGDLSYVPQKPWVFPGTIKQNILFGEPYRRHRYQTVLRICGLQPDLDKLPTGDETIVKDNGINLSKGQQARVNLARAVYKDCDIYLLDDFSSSLDIAMQKYIFQNCITDFLSDKLCIVFSHDTHYFKEFVSKIIVENGMITSMITSENHNEITNGKSDVNFKIIEKAVDELDVYSEEFAEEDNEKILLEQDNDAVEEARLVRETDNLYHENKRRGKVKFSTYIGYIKYAGGYGFVAVVFLISVITFIDETLCGTYTMKWADIENKLHGYRAYNRTNGTEYEDANKERSRIVNFYAIATGLGVGLLLIKLLAHAIVYRNISKSLHKAMMSRVVNAKMQFFDMNFIGNILNRFSVDLSVIDETIPQNIYRLERGFLNTIVKISLIVYVNPIFLVAVSVLFVILYFLRRWYIPAGRSLMRLHIATKSPVVGHLNASLEGLVSVRAFSKQEFMCQEFSKQLDIHMSAYYMFQISTCAFGLSVHLLCTLFTASIVIYFLISNSGSSAGSVGLAVNAAFTMALTLQQLITEWADIENRMTSLERAMEYTDVQIEHKVGKRDLNCPSPGHIQFEDVSLTYNGASKVILKNMTFGIEPKEKIGIVGRTGAGKSSILAALFQLYDSKGQIHVNGVDSRTLALDYLRSNISIIPQDLLTFTESVKFNLDPKGMCSDEEIWKAIEIVGLKDIVNDIHTSLRSYDNFSVGQKQLLCFARALVQKNSIVVLDEVTANMDEETASLIQNTIHKQFASCTVLIIAHRLSSVMGCDRIMVIDQGRLIEFDKPTVLLENKDSKFYKMTLQANLL